MLSPSCIWSLQTGGTLLLCHSCHSLVDINRIIPGHILCFLVGAASLSNEKVEVGSHRTESSDHCITPKATISREMNLPLAGVAFGVMQWSEEVNVG